AEAADRVGRAFRELRITPKCPSLLTNTGQRIAHTDSAFQLLQCAKNQGTMSPRTVVRYVQMIAAGLGLESRGAIGRDPIAKTAVRALECAARVGFGRKLSFTPSAINENSHGGSPGGSRRSIKATAPAMIVTLVEADPRCGYG